MHVCMIMSGYQETGAPNTGAELQAATLIRELRQNGCQVTVIAKKHTWRSPWREAVDGVTVYRVGPPGVRRLMAAAILWRHRREFDILHVHGQDGLGVAAIALARLFGLPSLLKFTMAGHIFVRTALDKPFPRSWRLFRRLSNRVARQATAYIAISEKIAEELPRAGFYAERTVRIPNGVDTKRFHPVADAERAALRRKLGLPETPQIVLFASRLIPRKGFDLLLRAWAVVTARFPGVRLVVAGRGPAAAVQALRRLKEAAPAAVTYVGEVADTAPYLQCADVFVFPSRGEGLPNALLEAMACGCACAASDLEGCQELLDNGQCGVLFTKNNASALTAAVCALLDDPARARALGQAAHHRAAVHFDITAVARRIMSLYEALARRRSSALPRQNVPRPADARNPAPGSNNGDSKGICQ